MFKNYYLTIVLNGLLLFTQVDTILCSPVHHQNEIDEMKTAITDLHHQNIELGTRLKDSESKTTLLLKQINQLSKDLSYSIKQHEDNKDDKNKGGVHRILKRSVLRRRRIQAYRKPRPRVQEIGFQASLTSQTQDLKHGEPIKFNHVITHFGNAYNKKTGIFTTPIAGTYMFNVHIVAETGFYIEAGIQVNNKPTVTAVSDHMPSKGTNTATWDQGTVSAILKLKKGDKVSVVLQWPKGSHSIHGLGTTNFSGYLLRQHF